MDRVFVDRYRVSRTLTSSRLKLVGCSHKQSVLWPTKRFRAIFFFSFFSSNVSRRTNEKRARKQWSKVMCFYIGMFNLMTNKQFKQLKFCFFRVFHCFSFVFVFSFCHSNEFTHARTFTWARRRTETQETKSYNFTIHREARFSCVRAFDSDSTKK